MTDIRQEQELKDAAHEIWAMAQLGHEEGIEDAVTRITQRLSEMFLLQQGATDEALRSQAIAIICTEADEMGYCDEDVADFRRGKIDGGDLLTLQAVERALRSMSRCSGQIDESSPSPSLASDTMLRALKEIRDQDEYEIALDPDWPRRIAAQALAHSPKPETSAEVQQGVADWLEEQFGEDRPFGDIVEEARRRYATPQP